MPRTKKEQTKVEPTSVFQQIGWMINGDGELEDGRVIAHRSPSSHEHVNSPFTVADYDMQRPAEADPRSWEEIFRVSDNWYQKNGLIRNIIDLMADFCVAGIQVSSPVPSQQAVLRKWFEKVNGRHVSERIANMLYRLGNVGIRRQFSDVNIKLKEKWQKAAAKFKTELTIPDDVIDERKVPGKYITINPKYIKVPSPEISAFLKEPYYGLRITKDPMQSINIDNDVNEHALLDQMTAKDIREALETGKTVRLDNNYFRMLHYKKDDFDKRFSYPLIYAALSDLSLYSKMMLTDRNVVDSASNRVIFVKVGDPKQNIYPSEEFMKIMGGMINKAGKGGSKSYIFSGPHLSLEAADGSLSTFLGKAKYEMVLEAIYATFGVPSALTGTASGAAANNYMSMKVLIKKLEYVRQILMEFWMDEIRQVCAAFDFKSPVFLTFTYQELGDEAAIKKLIQDMWDRDVISDESYRYFMGADHRLEELRLKADRKQRRSGKRSPKASPYHSPNLPNDLAKITVQQGTHAPEDWGIRLEDVQIKPPVRKPIMELRNELAMELQDNQAKINMKMETHRNELQIKRDKAKPKPPPPVIQPGLPQDSNQPITTNPIQEKPKDESGKGRPPNTPDQKPRKQREYKPKKK